MAMPNVLSEEQLLRFLEKHVGDRLKTELLAFWGRHPNAKFTRGAIYCALDCTKSEMEKGLKDMVETGLVDTCTHNGVSFYSLTANEERRRAVIELASLDYWERHQLMVKYLGQGIGQPHYSSTSCQS